MKMPSSSSVDVDVDVDVSVNYGCDMLPRWCSGGWWKCHCVGGLSVNDSTTKYCPECKDRRPPEDIKDDIKEDTGLDCVDNEPARDKMAQCYVPSAAGRLDIRSYR